MASTTVGQGVWDDAGPLSAEEMAAVEADSKRQKEKRDRLAAEKNRRAHPLTRTMRDVGGGRIPSGAEIDRLNLSAAQRHKLEDGISAVTSTRQSGENQRAEEQADELGRELFDSLPADQIPADYAEEPKIDDRGPSELAAEVSRW